MTPPTKRCPFCAEEILKAAIVCTHCGRDVVSRGSTRASVLTPPRSQASRLAIGLLVVFIGLVGLSILGALMTASNTGSTPSAHHTLNVTVRWGMSAIEITNAGSGEAAGQTMIVYINGTPGSTYQAETMVPALRESVRIPLSTFTHNSDRFNPIAQAVTVAWIGGGGYDFSAFGHN